MTLLPRNRKRKCSGGEEDFLPLSKKINNLHINNWGNLENSPDQFITFNNNNIISNNNNNNNIINNNNNNNNNNTSDQWLNSQHTLLNGGRSEEESLDSSPYESAQESNFQNNFNNTDEHFEQDSHESSNSQLNNETENQETRPPSWSMVYNPDLNMEENPYYYENNKLLFELYVARLQRGGY